MREVIDMKKGCVLWSCLLAVLTTGPAMAQTAAGLTASRPAGPTYTDLPASADYRLVAGDKLRIEVYKEPQLSQSLQIRPDGKITLPLVGDVLAAGVTPQELTKTLTERLREFVTAPAVTVIVAETIPPMIYVMGEVTKPGALPITGPMTVVQALAVAGGFKEFANPKKIRILRKGSNGTVQTIDFDYRDAIASPDRPLLLQPGDTVIVP
jgi:polysaccharide biosynthesis/export protein